MPETTPILTAGVYLRYRDAFVFQCGPNPKTGQLALVRVGGHVDPGETVEAAAVREALEETGCRVTLLHSPSTYQWDPAGDASPSEITDQEPRYVVKPVLRMGHNAMFWAVTDDVPRLASETQGLVLLTAADIARLADGQATYGDFTAWGGRCLSRSPYEAQLPIQPFPQFRFLAWLLHNNPQLAANVFVSAN
ncbi:NUDIX hydrolase [Paenibacillus sp. HJGM_3]|uniref:NUDIX hydrolase n=1 Tax=Paenibacillus sp. HJGM_3 TaxID=3379816 RepID=UPI0038597FA4